MMGKLEFEVLRFLGILSLTKKALEVYEFIIKEENKQIEINFKDFNEEEKLDFSIYLCVY